MSVQTTPDYWDCDCAAEYIHPVASPQCGVCGALREEQPEARLDELYKGDNMAPPPHPVEVVAQAALQTMNSVSACIEPAKPCKED